jgi:hypothetical protein
MNIEKIIEKLYKIKEKENDEKLTKFIKELCSLKNKVVSAIEEERDCFLIEGYSELNFAGQFFDKIEKWGCTRYDDTYKVTITEKGLLKLNKELKKYNLNVY